MATKRPISVRVRMYQVGFGDCFLLSFQYREPTPTRHVLIDFGTTEAPNGSPTQLLLKIAKDIQATVGSEPFSVVATHRHADHISGFDPGRKGEGAGALIAALKPRYVVQPWTEQPDLAKDATAPTSKKGMAARRESLETLHALAERVTSVDVPRLKRSFGMSATVKELSFIGEDNLKNLAAVTNLMTMGENDYVYAGKRTKLATFLPGVSVDVLGPPTVKQHAGVKRQRQKDPDEFWALQARGLAAGTGSKGAAPELLFRNADVVSGGRAPPWARWIVRSLRQANGEQMLQLVRTLDSAMNNTSVILLFECEGLKLLFPGDAQIENWEYALSQKDKLEKLKDVAVYKVGHHGSTNATPKTLWNDWFPPGATPKANAQRPTSFMSTKQGKHGSVAAGTEVPRSKLVTALKKWTRLMETDTLELDQLYTEETFVFSGEGA